jgi:hypothetical protein
MHAAQVLCGVGCKSSQMAYVCGDLSPNGHNPADLVICDDDLPHLRFGVSIKQDGSRRHVRDRVLLVHQDGW